MNQHRLAWVNSPRTESLVMAVILLNAVILTAETMASGSTLQALKWADKACLAFFLAEIGLRLAAAITSGQGLKSWFQQGWNVFDVVATLAAFIPGLGALRTLRLLRLVARIPAFKDTVEDLLHACQRSLALFALMLLLLFLGALTGTLGFQHALPELFGSVPTSVITVFGLMLGDNVAENLRQMWAIEWKLAVVFMLYTLLIAILVLSLVVSIVIEVAQARQKQRSET